MDTTMNAAYYRHIFSAEEAAKIRDSIIGLYGKCDNSTAVKAYHDGIIHRTNFGSCGGIPDCKEVQQWGTIIMQELL